MLSMAGNGQRELDQFDQALKRLRFLERGDAPYLSADQWSGLRGFAAKAAATWGRLPDDKRRELFDWLAERED